MPISDNITNGLIVSGRLKTAIRNCLLYTSDAADD